MAVAFDVSGLDAPSNFGVTSCTTASFTIASTANRAAFLALAMSANSSTGFSSSCAGTSGSAISGTDTGTARTYRILAHQVIAPATGSQTATMSWTTACDAVLMALVFNGVDQTNPFVNGTTANGATGAPSITPTGSGANNLSCAAITSDFSPSSPSQTTRITVWDNGSHYGSATTGAAGATHSWSDGFLPYVVCAVHVQEPQSPIEQEGFRFRNDDGSETTATWAAAQDTNLTAPLSANLRLRFLMNATGDPAAIAYTLYHQKNGAGGYTAVPITSTSDVPPAIVTADATESGDNATTPTTPWSVSTPALATGDLIIMIVAWDDSVTNTGITPAAGPNSESWTQISSVVASNGTEVRLTAYYTVATGSWSAGSISVTPAANEQWTACVLKVPAGEFDGTTPIGAANTLASTGTAETTVNSPSLSAGASDGGGAVIWAAAVDADPQSALSSSYTAITNTDRGQVSLSVQSRVTASSDSESISAAEGTRTIASDSWCSLIFIVRGVTVNNPIYVSPSANITAGGEATTAQLTAPSGKTTSDFVTGRMWDNENGTDTIDITTDDYTEVEWCLIAQSPAVNGDYFDFRVYKGSSAADTYTLTPRWTIGTAGGTTRGTPFGARGTAFNGGRTQWGIIR